MGQDNPERKGCLWRLAKPAGSHPCPLCHTFLMPPRARAFLSQRLCPCLPPARVLGCQGGAWQHGHLWAPSHPHLPCRDPARNSLSILSMGSHLGRLPCSIARVLSPLTCRGEGRSHACHVSHFPISHLSCHPHSPSLADTTPAAPGAPAHLIAEPRKLLHRVPVPSPARGEADRLHRGWTPSGLPPARLGLRCRLPAHFPPRAHWHPCSALQRPLPSLSLLCCWTTQVSPFPAGRDPFIC